MSLHRDVVPAAFVLPAFDGPTQAVVQSLADEQVVVIGIEVAGACDNPTYVVIAKAALALHGSTDGAPDLRWTIKQIVVVAA